MIIKNEYENSRLHSCVQVGPCVFIPLKNYLYPVVLQH